MSKINKDTSHWFIPLGNEMLYYNEQNDNFEIWQKCFGIFVFWKRLDLDDSCRGCTLCPPEEFDKSLVFIDFLTDITDQESTACKNRSNKEDK